MTILEDDLLIRLAVRVDNAEKRGNRLFQVLVAAALANGGTLEVSGMEITAADGQLFSVEDEGLGVKITVGEPDPVEETG